MKACLSPHLQSLLARRPASSFLIRWPLVAWFVQMFVDSLGLVYTTILGGMDVDTRAESMRYFTDPNSHCQLLLTTLLMCALGLNLRESCSRTILLKTPPNLNTLLPAIGRVHRLGQTNKQKVRVLFGEHTIERYLEYNNTKKALPQLAADLDGKFVADMVAAMRKNHNDALDDLIGNEA
ncbi:P-loop containing nucleoside triphosphate hydrolase protein [Aspergillus karnatakaensis]|uniref:P-loop containing nucleoside triphosphate hydrolase protein n=1 Tax=Aspergillus karnatakaensis TaxID=1810916 RepID=UPI003CCCA465